MSNKVNIYLASGWYSPATEEIRKTLETMLSNRSDVELYSPLRDGILLPPNQKHSTEVREKVFNENISHITASDLVVANIYSGDPYNDPGTMYEIGYAMAHNVPVIGFTTILDNVNDRFKGILSGITLVLGYEKLNAVLDVNIPVTLEYKNRKVNKSADKILFVGNGDKLVDEKVASYIMDSGASIRWLEGKHDSIEERIDEIFENIDYMITITDDRKTIVNWMIGQAYARGIPVVTYSDNNYGLNVMLLVSVLTHIRGTEELTSFLHQVKRYGLSSIPKFDISQLESM